MKEFYQYNDSHFLNILTAVTLDLNISPLYRINGKESPSMPGLLAVTPPRKAARGRDLDRLLVYLLLTGNASFTSTEYRQLAETAAGRFYKSPGTLTSAMRAAAEAVNSSLLEHNLGTSGRGQYAIGWLALGALRGPQFTFLFSGLLHVFVFGHNETKHIFEPTLSGKGLGMAQTVPHHFAQVTLQTHDRILLCGKIPGAWESALEDRSASSLEIIRRRLVTVTNEDLSAVLMQMTEGAGAVNFMQTASIPPLSAPIKETPPPSASELQRQQRAESQPEPAPLPAHVVQPSAYAIPPQPEEDIQPPPVENIPASTVNKPRQLPASLPRAKPRARVTEPPAEENIAQYVVEKKKPETSRDPSERTRQAAKVLAGGLHAWRRGGERLGTGLQRFLPRLLPSVESSESLALPSYIMVFIAILIPLIVVAAASVVYLRYGRSAQCETYLQQAQNARTQAATLTDPIMQRDAWRSVYLYVEKAEACRATAETIALRQEAETRLDQLLGIVRLRFNPTFPSGLGIKTSRMAASETDLFLLDAQTGAVTRATLTNRGFELDDAFNCKPDTFGGYQVGPLVDILALPLLNSINATLLGVDATGNLLYCAPGQVAQAIPLPPPDTNWGRVTAMTLDSGNLYVMDAQSRAVWVYTGKDGTFVDRPYFFFGGQIPEIQDAIDMAVSGDDLYILHSDGHLSVCSYSRIASVPTRCQDPATLVNPFGAYQDTDLFAQAHFTQMMFTAPPDQAILLLDADSQSVLRLTPRSLELQNQLRPTTGVSNPIPQGPVGSMTAGPNHILYLAIEDMVYFSADLP